MTQLCFIAGILSTIFILSQCSDFPIFKRCDKDILLNIVRGFKHAVHYMTKARNNINLDGALGCRIANDQIKAILRSPLIKKVPKELVEELSILKVMTSVCVKDAITSNQDKTEYFNQLQFVLDPNTWDLWYPNTYVNYDLQVEPCSCKETNSGKYFNEAISDNCMHELSLRDKDGRCPMSQTCVNIETVTCRKDYILTHQALYFQIAEKRKCLSPFFPITGKFLRDNLCANILRDANRIAEQNYPEKDQDLFLEQIGICGLWGYRDFFNFTWLEEILKWQKSNGCYAHNRYYECSDAKVIADYSNQNAKIRVKREDKRLPDGCSSHMTAVSLLALITSLRFCMEDLYKPML